MSERTSLMETKSRLRRILAQPLLTGAMEEIAVSHETNRQSVVKEILVHIFLIAKFIILPGGVTAGEARSRCFLPSDGIEAFGFPNIFRRVGVGVNTLNIKLATHFPPRRYSLRPDNAFTAGRTFFAALRRVFGQIFGFFAENILNVNRLN